jgi:hypothetical protein
LRVMLIPRSDRDPRRDRVWEIRSSAGAHSRVDPGERLVANAPAVRVRRLS